MQIKRRILQFMLCLLPVAALAQAPAPDAEVTPEQFHQELGVRMLQYVDELTEVGIVGNIQFPISETTPVTTAYAKVLSDKLNTLEERYNSINVRWNTFIQAMQMDIADDEDLMNVMANVEHLKQLVSDTIKIKRQRSDALRDFAEAEESLEGQLPVYKSLYDQAFKLSLLKKLAPQLEKLKAQEQISFAQLEASYQKAQQACEVLPELNKRKQLLDDTFASIQMVSAKIQELAYKPFVQRIKDYLISLACVAMLLLFVSMIRTKLKSAKAAREQAKQYKEMMRRSGQSTDGYPTI